MSQRTMARGNPFFGRRSVPECPCGAGRGRGFAGRHFTGFGPVSATLNLLTWVYRLDREYSAGFFRPLDSRTASHRQFVDTVLDSMNSIAGRASDFWQKVLALLRNQRESGPIDNFAKLEDFVATRAAYVAQKTLYGYVKTRMGSRYIAMFEKPEVIASLNIAKMQVFAACLSDLTIYAVGMGLRGQPVGNDVRYEMAARCYAAALGRNASDAPVQFSPQDCVDGFNQRAADTDWQAAAIQPENFSCSPKALVRWAPIADNLKNFDAEIVENSVKFAWRDIREQLRMRIDAAAIYADWSRQAGV